MKNSSNPTVVLTSTPVTHVEHDAFLPLAPLTTPLLDAGGSSSNSDTRPAPETTNEGRSRTTIPTHHFTNVTASCENKPGYESTSLALLGCNGLNRSHSRGLSSATMTLIEEGTFDNGSPGIPRLHPAPSNIDLVHEGGDRDEETEPDPAPFKFGPYQLASLVDTKNLGALETLGGIIGLLAGLGVDPNSGLLIVERPSESEDPPAVIVSERSGGKVQAPEQYSYEGPPFTSTVQDRERVYGANVLPVRGSRPFLRLMWLAFKHRVSILASIVAVISLALGFFGLGREKGKPPVAWVEGVVHIGAIFIVVIICSLSEWQKEKQLRILDDKKEERSVKVIRCSEERDIDAKDLLVGDIALFEPGEIIPCGGVFISGHNVTCDESGATGKSDAIKKASYDDRVALRETANGQGFDAAHTGTDCFMVPGSKVLDGHGKYVVIAVGQKSFNGRVTMTRGDPDPTPLQKKSNELAEDISKIGCIAGLALFTALTIRFFAQLGPGQPYRTTSESFITFTQILIISVTVIVAAVPEGLPLAVTLALAVATKRMTADKLLVRIIGSCETMANASVVCTDKTGILTQGAMTVVTGSIGVHGQFPRNLKDSKACTNAPDQDEDRDPSPEQDITEAVIEPQVHPEHADDFWIDQSEIRSILSPQLRRLFNQSIAINSTAFEDIDPKTKEVVFVGSKTETALLQFAKDLGWENWKHTRDSVEIVHMIPFSSERKAMGVVIRVCSGHYRLFLKGASEILTKMCTRHVVVSKDADQSQNPNSEIDTRAIDETAKDNIRTIISHANQTSRTIALCYRDFSSWPPPGAQFQSADEISYDHLSDNGILVAIIGIGHPLRPGVCAAVAACRRAGVTVKMCTGDNVLAARSIATQCGIYNAGGIIMEGPDFRALDPKARTEVVPRLQVLARSSPEDKKILVETLRSLGDIVGVTGGGTNDGPALKTADVGFSMGIAGTEAAKEASGIILMDDNFSSIVEAITWGRCVNDAVRKFLQFQISANITTVIITFVSAVASGEEGSVLTAIQLLWVNIIMDTFAALALATDPASKSLLDRKPDTRGTRLFTADMIKMILGQSIYQVAIILIFHFLGHSILGLDHSDEGDKIVATLVFNALVFALVFNSFNCRRLDQRFNIFEGIFNNWYFVVVILIEMGGQILIVFVGGAAFRVKPIPAREWGISLALGFASIPLGILIRCIPTPPLEHAFIRLRIMSPEVILPITGPKAVEPPALVASYVGAGSSPS
ncbi:Ca-transporting ATPase [Thelephora terrestris]|uniref:Calcium-transporting ATPase n=1 Tax=Thelephora terrestris TaxID=56493 RepID=A0A9P6H4V7_9AGAM|nr:Ca-transporting ATPase [Thelephora terrestris]